MNWFKQEEPKIEYRYINTGKDHIHELPEHTKLPEITGDLRESIKALVNHPGFNYLLQRYRFQKAAMETSLREGMNLTEIQLRYLQAGIYWASQFERDVALLTQSRPTARPATDHEAEEFAKVRQSLEMIGQE